MIKKLLSNWQEPAVWFPILLLLAWLCIKVIPPIDPTAGVDGLGFISGLVQAAALVAFVFFFSWLYHRTYDSSDDDEKKSNADQIRANYPLVFFLVRNARDLAIVLIVLYCFKR